jgi:hypothetical protein
MRKSMLWGSFLLSAALIDRRTLLWWSGQTDFMKSSNVATRPSRSMP